MGQDLGELRFTVCGWRPSQRGNLWRRWRDGWCVIFSDDLDDGFRWIIDGPAGKITARRSYASVQAAKAAAWRVVRQESADQSVLTVTHSSSSV